MDVDPRKVSEEERQELLRKAEELQAKHGRGGGLVSSQSEPPSQAREETRSSKIPAGSNQKGALRAEGGQADPSTSHRGSLGPGMMAAAKQKDGT